MDYYVGCELGYDVGCEMGYELVYKSGYKITKVFNVVLIIIIKREKNW